MRKNKTSCYEGVWSKGKSLIQGFTRNYKSTTNFDCEFDCDDICDNGLDRFVVKEEKNLGDYQFPMQKCFFQQLSFRRVEETDAKSRGNATIQFRTTYWLINQDNANTSEKISGSKGTLIGRLTYFD